MKMKNGLLLLTLVLIFSSFSLLMGQAAVGALGAPTDNTSTTSMPAGDQSKDEIKPPVEYVLVGRTAQSETTPPNFIADFVTAPGQKEFTVTGDENWYLNLDINVPGWIYIYEYFPAGQASHGQWIAYKWQLPESGLWQFGPFMPAINEPEGQHIYGIWFYSDGQWAAGNPQTPQHNLIYWTYTKGKTAEPISLPSPVTPAKADFPATLLGILTRPVVGASLLVVILALALLPVYFRRWRSQHKIPQADEAETARLSAALPSPTTRAKLALPNGTDIRISGNSMVIGRGDLARALSLDDLALISRRHFEVKSDDEQFYVEDLGSANGTRLNGRDISGQGPISLNDDDIIEPAGAAPIKFHLL